jgi:hypothetical protein
MSMLTLDEFKRLQPKQARADYLKQLRLLASDNEIRTFWDLKFDAFNYHLKALGLKDTMYGKKVETNESVADRARKNAGSNKKNQSNIIELEYKVVEKEEVKAVSREETQLALEAPKGITHMISYPAVVGNVSQLRRRLEAILTLVELDGEDAELVLSITIDRK